MRLPAASETATCIARALAVARLVLPGESSAGIVFAACLVYTVCHLYI